MAFMVPVVKKNYTIYGDGSKNLTDGGGGGLVRKPSQGSASSGGSSRRKVSASQKPCQQEGGDVIIYRVPIPRNNSVNNATGHHQHPASVPVGIRRGRGSAPALGNSSFFRQNSLPVPPNSVPTQLVLPVSPTHSTGSTSSDSSSEDHPHHHGFHIKLFNRLKKSFRSKAPAPAAS